MALEAGVPVIPVAMINTFDIQPPGQVVPRIMRVGIRFGEPLDFSRYAGMSGDRFVLRSVTDEIMYELMLLSGQEYVDTYAATAKRQAAKASSAGPPDDDPHDADPVVEDTDEADDAPADRTSDDTGNDLAERAREDDTRDGDPPARRAS